MTKLLDEIICLWAISEGGFKGIRDYGAVKHAIAAIQDARAKNPNYPTTMSLAKWIGDV